MTRVKYRGSFYWADRYLEDKLLEDDACSMLRQMIETEDPGVLVCLVNRLAEWFDALDVLIDERYTSWDRVEYHYPEIYEAKGGFERQLRHLLCSEHEEVVADALLAIRDQATLLRLLLSPWKFDSALLIPTLSHVTSPEAERELYDRSLNLEVREHIWTHTESPELLMQIALGSDASRADIAYERLQEMAISLCAKADALDQEGECMLEDSKRAWLATSCAMRSAYVMDRTPEIESLRGHFVGDELFECLMRGWFEFAPSFAGIISLSKEQLFEIAAHGSSPEGRWAAVERLDHNDYVKLVECAEDLSMLHTTPLGFHFSLGKLRASQDCATMNKIVENKTVPPAFRQEIRTELLIAEAIAGLGPDVEVRIIR